jgi:uncharacterized protein YpmB
MVAQLVGLMAMLVFLVVGSCLFLLWKAMQALKNLADNAILAGKAKSATDLAQAKEYSEDAALSRELTRGATGSAIQDLNPPAPEYTTPDGTKLKVILPIG